MAVHRNDKLAKVLSGTNTNSRFTTWLWLYLKNKYRAFNLGEFKSSGMRDRMADLIIQLPELHSEIEQQKMLMLLPDKSLEWVTQSKRQHNWICRRIIEKGNYFPIDLPPNLTGRDLAISTIDIWTTNQQSKYTEVLELSSAWTVQEKADQAFQWFYGKDEEKKCELAWRVLDKKFPNLATTNNQFKNHEELLSFIDRNPPSDSDVELFIKSVKSQWSQKNTEKNKPAKSNTTSSYPTKPSSGLIS